MITRDDIITEALTWIGTPYKNRGGPIKGESADCATFVSGIAGGVGLLDDSFLMPAYSTNRHFFNTDERYRRELEAAGFISIPVNSAAPGDLLLFVMGRSQPASHTAVLMPENKMIHAYQTARKVAINRYSENWQRRARYAYKFPGVE